MSAFAALYEDDPADLIENRGPNSPRARTTAAAGAAPIFGAVAASCTPARCATANKAASLRAKKTASARKLHLDWKAEVERKKRLAQEQLEKRQADLRQRRADRAAKARADRELHQQRLRLKKETELRKRREAYEASLRAKKEAEARQKELHRQATAARNAEARRDREFKAQQRAAAKRKEIEERDIQRREREDVAHYNNRQSLRRRESMLTRASETLRQKSERLAAEAAQREETKKELRANYEFELQMKAMAVEMGKMQAAEELETRRLSLERTRQLKEAKAVDEELIRADTMASSECMSMLEDETEASRRQSVMPDTLKGTRKMRTSFRFFFESARSSAPTTGRRLGALSSIAE